MYRQIALLSRFIISFTLVFVCQPSEAKPRKSCNLIFTQSTSDANEITHSAVVNLKIERVEFDESSYVDEFDLNPFLFGNLQVQAKNNFELQKYEISGSILKNDFEYFFTRSEAFGFVDFVKNIRKKLNKNSTEANSDIDLDTVVVAPSLRIENLSRFDYEKIVPKEFNSNLEGLLFIPEFQGILAFIPTTKEGAICLNINRPDQWIRFNWVLR